MDIKDLSPRKDVKGGSPVPEQKKPKSDEIRKVAFSEYLRAHSHSNGGSMWGGFFRSNLFVGLLLWILSQAVLLGGSYFLNYARTSQLVEWKATVDGALKRMDEWGTTHGHYADERQDTAITQLQGKSETTSQLSQFVTLQSERNNEQDKRISAVEAQMAQMIPTLAEIKTKLNFVADLLDQHQKPKR